jgi:hypothetical protein
MTVVAVLALAVVGTGAAFAYRIYVGAPRSGEPPIIKADNSPTKVVPAPGDSAASKTPDRMLPAMAARSSSRAKRRRSTSIPGPDPRRVSAAEPERQPAAGRKRLPAAPPPATAQRHAAEQ